MFTLGHITMFYAMTSGAKLSREASAVVSRLSTFRLTPKRLLTYMSITDQIRAKVREHQGVSLFEIPPSLEGEGIIRELIVSEEVLRAISPPWPPHREGERHASFRALLDAFVQNEEISVSETPFSKPWDTGIARVHPVSDEIWDIRSFEMPPGMRCFGAFGGYNLFIALTWNYREAIETAEDWEYETNRCKEVWSSLFGQIERFRGEQLDEYLSSFLDLSAN